MQVPSLIFNKKAGILKYIALWNEIKDIHSIYKQKKKSLLHIKYISGHKGDKSAICPSRTHILLYITRELKSQFASATTNVLSIT